MSSPEKQEIFEAIDKAERESSDTVPPAPNVSLTTPTDWSRSATRPLSTDDHGFSVAYEHDSGLTVTLYQYTRGRTHIPNDLTSPIVIKEMTGAKAAIMQAVEFGMWQAAKELDSKTVFLGDSKQQDLWAQFQLTSDDVMLTSDIYVWAHTNTFFKLRVTCHSSDAQSNRAVLKPLLTSLGTPAPSKNE